MNTILRSIDVQVPVRDAYHQWTQFEQFPRFMDSVTAVQQKDERRLRWLVSIAGSQKSWEAEITEQLPEKRIAWKATEGAAHAGVVTFHRLSDHESRVTVQIEYAPEGLIENVGDLLGFVARGVERDLENFKRFIESRPGPTGRYRGRIEAPHERDAGSQA